MSTKTEKSTESQVEKSALLRSNRKFIYEPTEKIAVIEVDNFPSLGKLAALRFLEWVQQNPEGTISLPTGKTPEHFIKWVKHYLINWQLPATRKDLEENGVNPAKTPNMKSLSFVQIDEFYPINPTQNNSFHYYINKFYIREFGLDPNKALLINAWNVGMPKGMTPNDVFPDGFVDLSLRTRFGNDKLERLQEKVIYDVDQYCTEYENRIRELGGIGFFLGGIGPDGHIAFNIKSSDRYSTTRLIQTNYETQAAAASDLGGIEVARNRLVITIGLSTITLNPEAVAIILAAGEAKAKVIKDAIEKEPSNVYPATALQKLKNARFYVTKGAAKLLVERKYEDVKALKPLPDSEIERIVVDLALYKNKRLHQLTKDDFDSIRSSKLVLKETNSTPKAITQKLRQQIIDKIHKGLEPIEDQTFMHTAPHHDDIMLGYYPYIVHLVRSPRNQHYFNYMTSGFNAVTNTYARNMLENLQKHVDSNLFKRLSDEGYFDPYNDLGSNRDVYQYLDGVAAHSRSMRQEGEARRMLRNLIFLFEESNLLQLKNRIAELLLYFNTQYPGKKDLAYIQQIKGMIREWEADILWGYLGFNSKNINHLRLGFYKGDIFTEEPEVTRDVMPILDLMRRINPTIVTVALDPEASGPDTHYKVLQAISKALKLYQKETGRDNIEVWGYRNVWFRFHQSEANIVVPVSLNSMAILESSFDKAFGSQRDASFPSYELDGPFSRLAQKIMVEQYQHLKTCLGREYFNENEHPRLRGAHGLIYLHKMTLDEFYKHTEELKKSTENISTEGSNEKVKSKKQTEVAKK